MIVPSQKARFLKQLILHSLTGLMKEIRLKLTLAKVNSLVPLILPVTVSFVVSAKFLEVGHCGSKRGVRVCVDR